MKEGGKRIVEEIESTEHEQSDEVDVSGLSSRINRRKPYQREVDASVQRSNERSSEGAVLGVLVGLALGVTLCAALLFFVRQHKKRGEYDEL